jgi:hypothetical protein
MMRMDCSGSWGVWFGLFWMAVAVQAETIPLKFGWTPGMTAHVEFVGSRSNAAGELEQSQRLKGSYSVRVEDHDLGMLVKIEDIQLDLNIDPAKDDADPALLEAILHLASHPPGIVVSEQGAYLGLTDLKAAQARMMRLVDVFAPHATPVRKRAFQSAVAPFASEMAIRARAEEGWTRDVGFWVGAALKMEEWHTLMSTNALPALGDTPVAMKTRFRIARRTPCAGEGPSNCVELELTSAIDESQIGETLEAFEASQSGKPLTVPVIRHLEQTSRVAIIADPATLRPFQIRTERKTTIGMEVAGSLRGGTQTETLVRMFSYSGNAPSSGSKPSAE